MREDSHRRKWRARPSRVESDLISKEAIPFDGCEMFQLYGMHTKDWKERHEDSVSLNRPDPFGLHEYFVNYSLNKKKRWTICDEIKDRIEEVQDQRLNIRVSASVNTIDRSNTIFQQKDYHEPRDKLQCLEYHSVSRDGKIVTHKKAENGRARLRNFTHAPQPRRRITNVLSEHRRGRGRGDRATKEEATSQPAKDPWDWRPRKPARSTLTYRYSERRDWKDQGLELEEVEHQKLHIHYTTQTHSDKPSLHNKMASKPERFRKEIRYFRPHREPHMKRQRRRVPRDERVSARKAPDVTIPEDVYDVVYDAFFLDDILEEDDEIRTQSVPILNVVEDLSELVVRKREKRKKTGKKNPLRRFVDEVLKTPLFVPTPTTSGYGSEDDLDDDETEIPSTASTSASLIPLVALPTEMFTRLAISSLPNLAQATRLPCFPPAWEVHQKDSLSVLGKALITCVIARQFGEELRLCIVDDCACVHPSRPQLPPSEEVTPPDIDDVDGTFCEICLGYMDSARDDRLYHPFALSCAHVFCTDCWLSHISEAIHRKRLPAACLDFSCNSTVSVAAAKGLLNSSSVETYELATIETLKAAEKLTTCPDCKTIHYTGGSLRIACPCGTSLCAHCSSIDHSPLGCDVFEQYTAYMQRSGFTSIYSSSSEAPLIKNLVKCPKCSALMQKSEGCNHMSCMCGAEFCYCCGRKWSHLHYDCDKEVFSKISMVDVSTARQSPLLIPSLLTLAIEARTILIDRRKELRKRLVPLPLLERKAVERTFVQLSLIVELCYLSSRRSRRARELADRVKFWLDNFFNSHPKTIATKAHSLKALRASLIV